MKKKVILNMMFMFLFLPPDHTYKIVAHIQICDSNSCTYFQSLPKEAWGLLLSTKFSVHKWSLVVPYWWPPQKHSLAEHTTSCIPGSSWCLVVNNKILFVDNYASLSCDMSCLSIFWQKELSMVNRFDKFLWISNKYTIIWCISNPYLLVESVLYSIFDWQDFNHSLLYNAFIFHLHRSSEFHDVKHETADPDFAKNRWKSHL